MPSCEYCGAKVGQDAFEDTPRGNRIYSCSKLECWGSLEMQIDNENKEIEDDADIDMIGDDADYGLQDVGNK